MPLWAIPHWTICTLHEARHSSDLISTNLAYDRGSIEPLKVVQRGMNDLWSLVQS